MSNKKEGKKRAVKELHKMASSMMGDEISDADIRGTIKRMIKSASKGKQTVSQTKPFGIGEDKDARKNLHKDREVGKKLELHPWGGVLRPEPRVSTKNAEKLGEELKRRRKERQK